MGNLCYIDNENIVIKKYCKKCGDKFNVHYCGYSHRRSCRKHYFINNVCVHCHKEKGQNGRNCYHSIIL